jgi:phosphatidylglycerol:prolipoprotein diacylglycerol transferase
MFPKLISVGGFFLPTYGTLVSLGFLLGVWFSSRMAGRLKLAPEKIGDLAVFCALSGLAGAKLLMFVFDWEYYSANPGRIFSLDTLLSAGVFYGGFLGAAAFAWFYVRAQKLAWLPTLDALTPGVALGHAVGRIGCFAVGCCWGAVCDRPWAVTFSDPDAHALVGVPLGVALHPAQLYEALLTALVFAALWWRSRRPFAPGTLLALYLLLYSPARFFVEFFRMKDPASLWVWGLSWTQWIAAALFGLGLMLERNRRRAPGGPAGQDRR